MLRRIVIQMIAGLLLVVAMPAYAQLEDSEQIAFHSNMDGDFDIYIYNLAEDELTNITDNDVYDGNPVWSIDGRIAFVSNQHEDHTASPCIWSDGDITCLPYFEVDTPQWSPDGRYLVFDNFNDIFVWDGQETISVLADGVEFVTTVTWSPDSILMYTGSANSEFNIYLWDGTTTARLTDNRDNTGFGWSSDGRLVYRSSINVAQGYVGGDLYVWDGTESVNITNTASLENTRTPLYNNPQWSNDGRLAFVRSTAANTGDIIVWDGDTLTNITNDSQQNFGQPLWNAYGLLAYVASPLEGSRILTIRDGEAQTRIYESDRNIGELAWSRTGERLLFAVTTDGGRDIYVWSGGDVFNLTDNGAHNEGAVWQP